MCQKEGLLESVQNIVTSVKLKRKKEIRKLEIQMKEQKKTNEQKRIPRNCSLNQTLPVSYFLKKYFLEESRPISTKLTIFNHWAKVFSITNFGFQPLGKIRFQLENK